MSLRHPIRLVVREQLGRSRLTVFFRVLVALPYLLWGALWTIAVSVVALVNWFATLVRGTSPQRLHDFLAAYLRYTTHVNAFVLLAANEFPRFTGKPGTYPVDLEIDPPARQNRWKTGFRGLLAIPALLLAGTLTSGSVNVNAGLGSFSLGFGALLAAAFLAWFACLVRGRMPSGLSRLIDYGLSYSAEANGYMLLLTDRYPNADPGAVDLPAQLVSHPVRLRNADDGRRTRLSVFFRVLLAIPLVLWLWLWSLAAAVVIFINWVATLIRGSSPEGLHHFLAAYLRFRTHVGAYISIAADPYPGFTGAAGSYPVDLEIDPPLPQRRAWTFFRVVLAFPAILLGAALGLTQLVAALLGWFAALFTGRMPSGLQRLVAYSLRYQAQSNAFFYLLTERYPYSGPEVEGAQAPGLLAPDPAPLVA